jgi:hypothetical protein
MLIRFLLPAALLALTACAAAIPGYSPPPFREKKHATFVESGDIGSDGQYHLSDYEKALDCKRIMGSMHIIIARLRDAQGRARPSELATNTHKTIAPILLKGSTRGADGDGELTRERARLLAYNRHLASKNCATVDIEAEMKRPPEPADKKY